MKLRIPPPVIGLLIGIGMVGIAQSTGSSNWATGMRLVLGVLIASLGLAIDIISVVKFFKAKTTVNPLSPDKSSVLVTNGLYRFSRNPMYLGMLLILTGWAFIIGSLFNLPLLAFFVVLINELQIKPEEAVLRDLFPDDYPAYCQRVRRWL